MIDHGANAWAKLLRRTQSMRVRVGVIGDKAAASSKGGGNLTVGEVASFNEFGLGVPERSFIREAVDDKEQLIKQKLRSIAEAIRKDPRKSVKVGLGQFGNWLAGGMKQRIEDWIPPPNAPATIARKGSDTPLVDTGQLRSSITYDIEEGRQ